MEEKSREQETSAREISLIRELAQIRKEYNTVHSGVAGSKWSSCRKRPSI